MEEKSVVIIGATGSIGTQTIEVLRKIKGFKLLGFTYHSNEVKAREILKLFPEAKVFSTKKEIESFYDFMESTKPDITVLAIPGFEGFKVALKTIPFTKRLALANKESLVCGGKFIKEEIKRHGVELIPIDSEHSAIFQLMEDNVEKIAITASGGALRDIPLNELWEAKPEDVLKHPVWNMGARITVDSATMVNKAFEVLEAMELFSLRREQIEVYIHKSSIVHGMVFLKDGTVKIHAAIPDMRVPIAYSLTYPERLYEYEEYPEFSTLKFEEVEKERYPLFFLVDEIYDSYTLRTVFNAADEVAVDSFLKGKMSYKDLVETVEKAVEKMEKIEVTSPEELVEIDKKARILTEEVIKNAGKN
ncbi:MAG: 1-deoxy-D-xylulose-5-phosphate reductoisomerase [Thermotogaceae bacterium]|nr:1-deoxy-D-xylulose-5-phosphate reductoisomerase [Thermotogaceae bacterium]